MRQPGFVVLGKPVAAVLKRVERAIVGKLHIDQMVEFRAGHKALHRYKIAVGCHRHGIDPAPDPVVGEEFTIVVAGKLHFGILVVVVVVHGATHGVTPALAHDIAKLRRLSVGIIDECLIGGR